MIVDLNDYQNIKYLVLMSVDSNKNKWWSDDAFGSGLFLLLKSKTNKLKTANEVKRTIEESLKWIVNDDLAKNIGVEVEESSSRKDAIDWTIKIEKTNEEITRIEGVWENAES